MNDDYFCLSTKNGIAELSNLKRILTSKSRLNVYAGVKARRMLFVIGTIHGLRSTLIYN